MNDLEQAYKNMKTPIPMVIQRCHHALMWSENGGFVIGIGSKFGHRKVLGKYKKYQDAIKALNKMGFGGVYKKNSNRNWFYTSLNDEKNWRLIYNTRRAR